MPAKPLPFGNVYTRLTVAGAAPDLVLSNGWKVGRSLCHCTCGKPVIVLNRSLKSGNTKSCGCLTKETTAARSWKHGHASRGHKARIYNIWIAMNQRCSDPNQAAFADYGGRGIAVCERWRTFEHFRSDMGEGKVGWTIERIDNERGYELWNCCWATRVRQGRNKRNNRVLTVRGKTACLSELCEHFGIRRLVVWKRIARGWDVERAFFSPVKEQPTSHQQINLQGS